MKHLTVTLLALCLPLSLAACGDKAPVATDDSSRHPVGPHEPADEIDGKPEPYHPDRIGAKLMEEDPKMDASSVDCLSGVYRNDFSSLTLSNFLEMGSSYFASETFAASPDASIYKSEEFKGRVAGCTIPVDRPPFNECEPLQEGVAPDTSVSSDCTVIPGYPDDDGGGNSGRVNPVPVPEQPLPVR